MALKEMYDSYGLCAGRVVDLINWLDGGWTAAGRVHDDF